ncbi:MAG: T9SS type A sorting domain-containing protein [Chitinophagales bacterium]|nr:T9SS type A sorting domain-containing protein [Chitinophagales bacterium]MDW8419178.1 T9SS type A sorting domain-containing protein [Chitinophagales bacterium]
MLLRLITSVFLLKIALNLPAQVRPLQGNVPLSGSVQLTDTLHPDFEPAVTTIVEQPKPASDLQNKKQQLHQKRIAQKGDVKKNDARGANAPLPEILKGFNGNNAQGTPNDNHLAVSNSGWIVSVVNTNVRVYDTAGTLKSNKSLTIFAQPLGNFTVNSDPRVLYDPDYDRFIVVFFTGINSSTNKIIVAFSKTGDPTGQWHLYQLPGNYLNDSTWSDYPIVSIGKHDLFMTFNQLKDGMSWQTGFRYSIIWQIDKLKGYNGDTLSFNYWSNISFNGKPVWSVCPVMEATAFTDTVAYFLSVRPSALQNDTVFLHTITNTQKSGNATLHTRMIKTTPAYGLAPNGIQPDGQQLATNDARVLHAIIHGQRIYYAQNSITPYNTAGIYLGSIENPASANPIVSGQIIGIDTLDLGYPALANVGTGPSDYRTFMVCGYVSEKLFSGTAAFYIDNNFNVSPPLLVKTGEGNINVLQDTVERWGDYSGIQRVYYEPFTAWLAHSYGRTFSSHGTWIAKITTSDTGSLASVKHFSPAAVKVFPNPVAEPPRFSVRFESPKGAHTLIQLTDMHGRVLYKLLEDYLKAGINEFSFNPNPLPNGLYSLQVIQNGAILLQEKIIKNQ